MHSHHAIISRYPDTDILHISYTSPPSICTYQWTSASFEQAELLLQAVFLFVQQHDAVPFHHSLWGQPINLQQT